MRSLSASFCITSRAHRRTSINTYWVNWFSDSMYPLGSTGEHVLCYTFYYQHCEVLKNLVLLCSPESPPCFLVLTGDMKWRKVTQSASPSVSDQSCLTSLLVPILRDPPHLKQNQPRGCMSNEELKDNQERGFRKATYQVRNQYRPTVWHDYRHKEMPRLHVERTQKGRM